MKSNEVFVWCAVLFSAALATFVISAQSGFRWVMIGAFFALLFVYALSARISMGLLCFGFAYYSIIWASLWNAVLWSSLVTPVLKVVNACILGWLLCRKS